MNYRQQQSQVTRIVYDSITYAVIAGVYGGDYDERIKAGDLVFKNIFGARKFCTRFFMSREMAYEAMNQIGMDILYPIFGSEESMNQMGYLISVYKDLIDLKRRGRKARKGGHSNKEERLKRKYNKASKITRAYIKWVKKLAGIKNYSIKGSLKMLKRATKNPYRNDYDFGFGYYDDDDDEGYYYGNYRNSNSTITDELAEKYDLGRDTPNRRFRSYDNEDVAPRPIRTSGMAYDDFSYERKPLRQPPRVEYDYDEYMDTPMNNMTFMPWMMPWFNPWMNPYFMQNMDEDDVDENDDDFEIDLDEDGDYEEDYYEEEDKRKAIHPEEVAEEEDSDEYPLERIFKKTRKGIPASYDDDDNEIEDEELNSDSISSESEKERSNVREVVI